MRVRYIGSFVGDRQNAEACIGEAVRAMSELNTARLGAMRDDTEGNANRLADYVRDAQKFLSNAEKFLNQRGEQF